MRTATFLNVFVNSSHLLLPSAGPDPSEDDTPRIVNGENLGLGIRTNEYSLDPFVISDWALSHQRGNVLVENSNPSIHQPVRLQYRE
jgi:hypothetical protein